MEKKRLLFLFPFLEYSAIVLAKYDKMFEHGKTWNYIYHHVEYNDLGKWNKGLVYSAPLWFGYKHHGVTSQFGISNRVIQSLTQNYVHKFMHTPYFMDYDNIREGLFINHGRRNRLSIWNF